MTDTSATPAPVGRGLNLTLWVGQVLLALFFVFAAVIKLLGVPDAVAQFDLIGFGQWFRYLVGALELAGAIGLLIPRLAGLAALGLAGVMVGAVLTQLFLLGPPVMALSPAALLVVFALIAWARRDQITALLAALRR